MKEKDVLAALLLWAVLGNPGLTSTSTESPSSPAPPYKPGPQTLRPGYWWGWFTSDESPQYQAWWESNRSNIAVRKTWGSPAAGVFVVLFQVLEPVIWNMPKRPNWAPRGMDTDLSDVAGRIARPSSLLKRMVEEQARQTWQYLRDLYMGRRPPRQPLPPAP